MDTGEEWIPEKDGYQRRMDTREGLIPEKDGYWRRMDKKEKKHNKKHIIQQKFHISWN